MNHTPTNLLLPAVAFYIHSIDKTLKEIEKIAIV